MYCIEHSCLLSKAWTLQQNSFFDSVSYMKPRVHLQGGGGGVAEGIHCPPPLLFPLILGTSVLPTPSTPPPPIRNYLYTALQMMCTLDVPNKTYDLQCRGTPFSFRWNLLLRRAHHDLLIRLVQQQRMGKQWKHMSKCYSC